MFSNWTAAGLGVTLKVFELFWGPQTKASVQSVQSLRRVWLSVTPWTAACQASLSITNSQSLLKLMSIRSVMPSNHLILCHSLLLPPSIFPSIRVFSNELLKTNKQTNKLMLVKIEGRKRRGRQDEMVGWHHWFNGYELGKSLEDSEGQGGLASCNPWDCRELDTT